MRFEIKTWDPRGGPDGLGGYRILHRTSTFLAAKEVSRRLAGSTTGRISVWDTLKERFL